MTKKNRDTEGVPLSIEIPVYYCVDDDGNILYDEEDMSAEMNFKLSKLPHRVKG